MGKKSEFSTAHKREIVLAILRRDDTISGLSRKHNVSQNTLTRWRDQFLEGADSGLAGAKSKRSPEQERIRQLEKDLAGCNQVIGELTIANRISKKVRDGLL